MPTAGVARHIGVAVIGYIAGCMVGTRITGAPVDGEGVWPAAVTRGLAVEAGLFMLYASAWWAVGGRPSGPATVVLLSLCALALGIQSTSVKRFGVADLSSTYLTGTLTTLVMRVATGGPLRGVTRHFLLLVALLCGGAIAAALAGGSRAGGRPASSIAALRCRRDHRDLARSHCLWPLLTLT